MDCSGNRDSVCGSVVGDERRQRRKSRSVLPAVIDPGDYSTSLTVADLDFGEVCEELLMGANSSS